MDNGCRCRLRAALPSRVAQVAQERMDQDPAFYKRFSQLIRETIEAFHEKRLMEAGEYLDRVRDLRDRMKRGGDRVPSALSNKREARAYYGSLREVLSQRDNGVSISDEKLAQAGIKIDQIVNDLKIVDWRKNPDVEKDMRNQVEDYLLALSSETGIDLSFDEIDLMLDQAIQIARSERDQ